MLTNIWSIGYGRVAIYEIAQNFRASGVILQFLKLLGVFITFEKHEELL
jgi:hypothetical protein